MTFPSGKDSNKHFCYYQSIGYIYIYRLHSVCFVLVNLNIVLEEKPLLPYVGIKKLHATDKYNSIKQMHKIIVLN